MKQLIQLFSLAAESAWEFDAAKNMFKKEVARTGTFRDRHGKVVTLSKEYFDELIRNFKPGDDVCVPLGHEGMNDPTKNTGYVMALERKGDSLYAVMDIKDAKVAEKIRNKSIKGVSIGVALMDAVGRVLNHVALTLSPAIANLGDFAALESEGFQVFEFESDEERELVEGSAVIIDALAERLKNTL